jgi:endonuclease/exonuclease/phosphatase family metal-dependent hydrolase
MARPVRFMSWNIHGGVGCDGVHDLDRIFELVRSHDPDIVSLQEVDSRGLPEGRRPLQLIAAVLGGSVAEASTYRSPDGDYGNVLVSRWPLHHSRMHDISIDGREPRAAIETTVLTPWGDMHVISVHFGLNIRERRRQAEKLLAIAEEAEAPVGVTLGDFNDWAWPGPVQTTLSRHFPDWTAHRTFPSRLPLFKLDRLYARPSGTLVRSWVDRSASLFSDHLPLLVDIDPTAAFAEQDACQPMIRAPR